MRANMYMVYDRKAQMCHSLPFFSQHDGAAQRWFSDMLRDKSSMVGKYPEDFEVRCVGVIDLARGQLVMHEADEETRTPVVFHDQRLVIEGLTLKEVVASA